MSAFCVFGMSKQLARQKAERRVQTYIVVNDKRVSLTASEWGVRVKEEADRMFDSTDKVAKISPAFDAPQFCRDWVAVSPGEVKSTRIMVRGPKTGDDGKPVLRKGAPVMTWLPYDEPRPVSAAATVRRHRVTA